MRPDARLGRSGAQIQAIEHATLCALHQVLMQHRQSPVCGAHCGKLSVKYMARLMLECRIAKGEQHMHAVPSQLCQVIQLHAHTHGAHLPPKVRWSVGHGTGQDVSMSTVSHKVFVTAQNTYQTNAHATFELVLDQQV